MINIIVVRGTGIPNYSNAMESISMCIYCDTNNYRKIYENHLGPIPKDNNDRTYEIHHIDGNNLNNHPDNLVAVSINDHYNIHYEQGDWAECFFMSLRMNLSLEEISELAKKNNNNKVKNGTHHFIGGHMQRKTQNDRVKNGTHHLLKREDGTSVSSELVKHGTHHLLGGTIQEKQLRDGTHPSQIKVSCIYCKKTMGKGQYGRYHGDKCKFTPLLSSVVDTQ